LHRFLDSCVDDYVVLEEEFILFWGGEEGKSREVIENDIKKEWAEHCSMWDTCFNLSEFGEVIYDPDAEYPA
jgi:hypothetical protein